jgi:hypothetical protein
MRPSVVIGILFVAVATALIIWFARPERQPVQSVLQTGASVPQPTAAGQVVSDSARKNDRAEAIITPQINPTSPAENHDEMVTRRVAELMAMAMTDDLASLNIILSELNNPDPEIRSAAVTATVQFDSALAIPALKNAYSRADDPDEKIKIKKAIDFLTTPVGT